MESERLIPITCKVTTMSAFFVITQLEKLMIFSSFFAMLNEFFHEIVNSYSKASINMHQSIYMELIKLLNARKDFSDNSKQNWIKSMD